MESMDILTLLHHALDAYHVLCAPVCKSAGLTQTAFDILMFLANHPEYNTAKDITQRRNMKANLVSFNVDKLVKEGYLQRIPIPGDRRKVRLVCTPQADPVIEQGRAAQQAFFQQIYAGFDEADRQTHERLLKRILDNVTREDE